MKYLIPAFAALALATSASAHESERVVPVGPNPQWEDIGTENGIAGAIDRATLRVQGGRILYVTRLRYLEPRDGVAVIMHQGEIFCASGEFRTVAFDLLDTEGELVDSYVAPDSEAPVKINSGSRNDDLRIRYCP